MTTFNGQRLSPPRVFISYSTINRPYANRLHDELTSRSMEVFLDHRSIGVGVSFLSEISDAIDAADYFVLLWSSEAAASPMVDLEWTVALARCVYEKFVFLYIIRIDDTEVPTILSGRRFLDGASDWDGAVNFLCEEWEQDVARSARPLVPAPIPPAVACGHNVVVRNSSLDFDHLVSVPASPTGQQIHEAVMVGLGLPERIVPIPNRLSIDFAYRLIADGREILPAPVVFSGLTDGMVLQLEVLRREVTTSSVSEELMLPAHRDEVEEAVADAFSHLIPTGW